MLSKLLVGFIVILLFGIGIGASVSGQTFQNWDEYLEYFVSQTPEQRAQIWDQMTEEQKASLFNAQEQAWDTYYVTHFKELTPEAREEILGQMGGAERAGLERAIQRADRQPLVFDNMDEFLEYYYAQPEERQQEIWNQLSDEQKEIASQKGWDNYLAVFETFSREQKEEIVSQMSHEQLVSLGEATIRAGGTTQPLPTTSPSQPTHSPLFSSWEEQRQWEGWYLNMTEDERKGHTFQDPRIKEHLEHYVARVQGPGSGQPGIPGSGSDGASGDWGPITPGPITPGPAESSAIPLRPGEEIAPPPDVFD